jgi:hypothetical protein
MFSAVKLVCLNAKQILLSTLLTARFFIKSNKRIGDMTKTILNLPFSGCRVQYHLRKVLSRNFDSLRSKILIVD